MNATKALLEKGIDLDLSVLKDRISMKLKGKQKAKRFPSRKVNVIKIIEELPERFTPALCPTNLEEEKEKFLKHGILPKFSFKGNAELIEKIVGRKRGQIKFDLLPEAKHILDMVRKKYGDGESFLDAKYGKSIDMLTASDIINSYLREHNLDGQITTYWSSDLPCSARMLWIGPNLKYNKPEARKYTLWIKNSSENAFLREEGIQCLADHEIGTHFFRMHNEGLQPWYSDRKRFDLRSVRCRMSVSAEEGLAAVNTTLNARIKLLWTPALLYYTACKAVEMDFKQLYDHLEMYMSNRELRWKHVMRVKRGLENPNDVGGYGNDQAYFEGAVEILRNVENIDFPLLFSGKICVDELNRIKRLARMDCIKLPLFLQDLEKYKKSLKQMAMANGLSERTRKSGGHKRMKGKSKSGHFGHSKSSHGRHHRRHRVSPMLSSSPALYSSDSPELIGAMLQPYPEALQSIPIHREQYNFVYPAHPVLQPCFEKEHRSSAHCHPRRKTHRPKSSPNKILQHVPKKSSKNLKEYQSTKNMIVEHFGMLERKIVVKS